MTTSDELLRFEALVEREAEGEPLSADERAFVERYAAQHSEAAEELAVLRALSGALGAAPRAEQPGDRELIAQVFAQGQALERGRRQRALIAGGVALAAGLLLWLARPSAGPELPRAATPTRAPATVRAVLATLSPGVSVNGVGAVAGAELGQGQRVETHGGGACLKLDRDVRACLAPGSLARVQSLAGHVVLALERGTLAADLGVQPAGTSFSVQSGALTVRAIGTRFGVQLAAGVVQLNVLSGIVEVRGDGATYRVSAPGRTALGTRHVEQLSQVERQATLGLLAPVLPEAAGAPEPALPPDVGTPERATSAAPAPVASAQSAGELLSRAREQRASGAMKDAARAYRRLLAEHPTSAEAHTARVALGQLELSSLAEPAAALGHFTEYLRRGGPLEQEARYGQVRALAALGRAGEEKQAIVTFLAKYPKALQSAALKERLKTLGGTGATLK